MAALHAAGNAGAEATKPSPPAANVASSSAGIRTGIFRGRPVTYAIIDGKPVFEGDIVLDHVEPLPNKNTKSTNRPTGEAAGIAYQYFWPKAGGVAQIPYIITVGSSNLTAALSQFNATFAGVIQFVPLGAQTDYVNFNLDAANHNGTCESSVGRVGGAQQVGGSIDCSIGTLLHEMGHVAGLYHEQSRPDRNTYVTVNYKNMIKGSKINFDQLNDNFQDLGLYDYASVMHYIPFAFTRNGGPVIESIPPGISLSNTTGYTAADIDGVLRLYGAAPASVTVTTNPEGLRVIADGVTYSTPHSFSWGLNTTHSLGIPSGAQMLSGTAYVYGRWNDVKTANHSIKVTPGIGTLVAPATSPAVTVYTANFIQLVNYTAAVVPTGAGSVTAVPSAKSYPGVSGTFYVSRQPVKLTATANSGYGFLEWGTSSPPFISPPWSANPKSELSPGAIKAYFSTQPITTIVTNPPGLGILVDGGFWYGPQKFASDYFPGWTAGSIHSVSVPSPQMPYSINSRYLFTSWSDKGAQTHNYTVPAIAATLTAKLTPQFVPIAYTVPSCAAAVSLSPVSPGGDGFYNSGTPVTFTAAAASGWVLTGWLDDLSGTGDPQTLAVKDEELAVANYDTTSVPLSITSLSPSNIAAGTGSLTVAINGTGFTSSSIVFVNNAFRMSQFVSAAQINVDLTAADLASPGAFPIAVSNFPPHAPCAAFLTQTFFVTAPH